MGNPIVIQKRSAEKAKSTQPDPFFGWSLLMGMGWLFLLVGLGNLVLIWLPLQFGHPEYEFASVAASFDSLPVPVMGLVFAASASVAQGYPKVARGLAGLAVFLVVLVVAGTVLYGLNAPIALKALAGQPAPRYGILKSIAKVGMEAVLYPIALLVLARRVWIWK